MCVCVWVRVHPVPVAILNPALFALGAVSVCCLIHLLLNPSIQELDPVTLHNQALMNMDSKPTEGFEKLAFLLQRNPFPPVTFGNLLLLYCKYEVSCEAQPYPLSLHCDVMEYSISFPSLAFESRLGESVPEWPLNIDVCSPIL